MLSFWNYYERIFRFFYRYVSVIYGVSYVVFGDECDWRDVFWKLFYVCKWIVMFGG